MSQPSCCRAGLPPQRIWKRIMDYCKQGQRTWRRKILGIIESSILKDWYTAYGFTHTGTQKFEHLPFAVGFMELDVLSVIKIVREVRETDLHSLLLLYTQLYDNPFPTKSTQLTSLWKKILNDSNHHIIVAEQDGLVVSSCVLVIIPNLTHNQRPYALIEMLLPMNVIEIRAWQLCALTTQKISQSERCYKISC